jgi:hypothetical protein
MDTDDAPSPTFLVEHDFSESDRRWLEQLSERFFRKRFPDLHHFIRGWTQCERGFCEAGGCLERSWQHRRGVPDFSDWVWTEPKLLETAVHLDDLSRCSVPPLVGGFLDRLHRSIMGELLQRARKRARGQK